MRTVGPIERAVAPRYETYEGGFGGTHLGGLRTRAIPPKIPERAPAAPELRLSDASPHAPRGLCGQRASWADHAAAISSNGAPRTMGLPKW